VEDAKRARKFMFLAGEASGDTLGAELIRALARRTGPGGHRYFGAGGQRMAAAGLDVKLDLAPHAVVGIWEVLKNYGKFKGFFDQMLELALSERPDDLILIDYPGFNLRFAKALRKAAAQAGGWRPRITCYVSPQIWAWHESRVHQIARDIDLMLSIFPFEKSWYAERKPKFRVEYVGHPLVDRFRDRAPAGAPAANHLTLLPGSRLKELRKHIPPMVEAAHLLRARLGATFTMVVPDASAAEAARSLLGPDGGGEIGIQIGGLPDALEASSAAIASSGTVTMECAWFRVPTVVLYKTSWSTHWLGRRFIKVKYLAMPNLLAGGSVYPELIQGEATGENLAREAAGFLSDPARAAAVRRGLEGVVASLGPPGASDRAAEAILGLANGGGGM